MSGRSESRSETPRSNEYLQESTQSIDTDKTDVSCLLDANAIAKFDRFLFKLCF